MLKRRVVRVKTRRSLSGSVFTLEVTDLEKLLVMGPYLPAGEGRLPLQNVLCERRRLQLILVKGHLVYNHGVRVQTGETNMWVG